MNSGEDLDVFKLAHQLALKTYATTKTFPKEELFSLGDQMRRAAASVGMNLMEVSGYDCVIQMLFGSGNRLLQNHVHEHAHGYLRIPPCPDEIPYSFEEVFMHTSHFLDRNAAGDVSTPNSGTQSVKKKVIHRCGIVAWALPLYGLIKSEEEEL
jgi:23S rRNA-intervening sequence protein